MQATDISEDCSLQQRVTLPACQDDMNSNEHMPPEGVSALLTTDEEFNTLQKREK